jgi:hypothetical protein
MAHFALIEQDLVNEVIVIANAAIDDAPYPESEPLGQAVIAESGLTGNYLQCSRSGSFRGAYPAPGWSYDPVLDEFMAPPTTEETP